MATEKLCFACFKQTTTFNTTAFPTQRHRSSIYLDQVKSRHYFRMSVESFGGRLAAHLQRERAMPRFWSDVIDMSASFLLVSGPAIPLKNNKHFFTLQKGRLHWVQEVLFFKKKKERKKLIIFLTKSLCERTVTSNMLCAKQSKISKGLWCLWYKNGSAMHVPYVMSQSVKFCSNVLCSRHFIKMCPKQRGSRMDL